MFHLVMTRLVIGRCVDRYVQANERSRAQKKRKKSIDNGSIENVSSVESTECHSICRLYVLSTNHKIFVFTHIFNHLSAQKSDWS